jgi:ketosteroid isomerase-like protein
MKNAIILAIVLAGVSLSDPHPAFAQDDHSEDSESILAVRASFNDSIANHDAASIAGYLDSEYQITTGSGMHYQETPEDEADSWAEMFDQSPDIIYVRTTEEIEVSAYLALAAENGNWVGRWTSPEGKIEMGGRYFAQWRKVDGEWKIRAEIFVTLYCTGPGCRLA